MSSIIVYGDSGKIGERKVIARDTVPQPTNFYGDSKLQAEIGIKELDSEDFKVVILRAPMVFGKGCRGNYPKLVKFARMFPIFPDMDNERSMIYIDHLCEFVRLIIDNEERGVFFPQNKEYVRTSDLVKCIAEIQGARLKLVKVFNPFLHNLSRRFDILNKVFGSLVYEKSLGEYKNEYRKCNMRESLLLTESRSNEMPKGENIC